MFDDSDCDNLQDNLNKLEIWQHEWQMQFNPSKCNFICISNKQRPPQRTYSFCGSKLEQVDSASYLGITINSKLKWSEHISCISSKASRSLGLIKRNLWNCKKNFSTFSGKYVKRPIPASSYPNWSTEVPRGYFNLRESPKKSCSFLPSKLQQNSKCDRHVIWSELGHIRNKKKEKQIDSNVQT